MLAGPELFVAAGAALLEGVLEGSAQTTLIFNKACMFFRQIYDEGLSQASYLIGCERTGEALVVDPRRDVDAYITLASEHDMRVTAVAETHIHADYLSGGRELAAATGATLHLSAYGADGEGYLAAQPGIRVQLLRDGDEIQVGDVRARALHTPGHTPEHLSFAIYENLRAAAPMMLLSGDFLFVGDVGRPDLFEVALGKEGTAASSARTMFASIQSVLARVPEYAAIWPAHGAGSACGKALGAIPSTTLGYERRFSWWSEFIEKDDERGFAQALLEGQPDAPTYFARMKHDNRGFTALLGSLPTTAALDSKALRSALAAGAVIVDTRPREEFCLQHVRGALSLPDRPNLSSRAAWFLAPETPIVLLARPERVELLVRRLVRVGLDRIVGYVSDVATLGLPTESLAQMTAEQAQRRWSARDVTLLDVRQRSEFADAHIPNTTNLSAGRLAASLASVPKDRPIVVFCAGGDRSVLAASALRAAGFADVTNMIGGFSEWRSRGLPAELAN